MSSAPIATFRYLFGAEGRPAGEVLESQFDRRSILDGRVVLWGAALDAKGVPGATRYEVYASAADALAARGLYRHAPALKSRACASPPPLCFHEVVFGWQPQRYKFDVEFTGGALDAVPLDVLPLVPGGAAVSGGAVVPGGTAVLGGTDGSGAPPLSLTAAARARRRARADAALRIIATAFLDEIWTVYHGRDFARPSVFEFDDLAVSESCGQLADGRTKFSYHGVLVPVGAPDAAEARALWARVAAALPPSIRPFLDLGANASTQNFRMLGSTKDGRTLRPFDLREDDSGTGGHNSSTGGSGSGEGARAVDPLDHLVCPGPNLPVYPRVLTDAPAPPAGSRGAEKAPMRAPRTRPAADAAVMPDRLVASILDEVRAQTPTALTGHAVRYTGIAGTLIAFDRQFASHCDLCGVTHENDNSLMLALEPDSSADADSGTDAEHGAAAPEMRPYLVVEHCRRAIARARGTKEAPPTRVVAEVMLTGAPAAPFHERAVGCPDDAIDSTDAGEGASRRPKETASQRRLCRIVDAFSASNPLGGNGTLNGSPAPFGGNGGYGGPAPTTVPSSTAAVIFDEFSDERRTVYSEPTMRPFPRDAPTLAVRAQMKMGKTRAVREWLKQLYPAEAPGGGPPLAPAVIRIVSFRVTFTEALRAALPGFVVYNELAGDLTSDRCPRLICQVESLHRIVPGGAPVDCLIVDESRSVLQQFDSGLVRRHQQAWAVFEWLVRAARRVVFMDANLGQLSARALARLRPAQPAHLVWNRHPRAAGDAFAFTGAVDAWLARLDAAIGGGQRVVVPTNSLRDAEGLRKLLAARHPTRSIALYTSKTPAGLKREHFSDVHRYWAVDVLIYTPTVTAGVSFELAHFDALYGLFSNQSCDVETCRQMLGRVRNLSTRAHFICVRASQQSLPETPEAIRRAVRDTRSVLFGDLREAGVQFRYDDAGEVYVHESAYFHLWVELQCLANQSRNDFAGRFVAQVRDTGASVAYFRIDPGDEAALNAAAALEDLLKEAKGEVVEEDARAVAEAPEIPEERAREIERAVADAAAGRGADVDPLLCAAAARFRLRRHYDWGGPVTPGFVETYAAWTPRRVFRNLARIASAPTLLDSLEEIQDVERARHVALMGGLHEIAGVAAGVGGSANEVRDLSTQYVFLRHLTAVKVLEACGFRCVRDERRVHRESLAASLQANERALLKALEPLSADLKLRVPAAATLRMRASDSRRYLSVALPAANGILGAMYGIAVKRVAPGSDFYGLACNATGRLFTVGPPRAAGDPPLERPHVPSQLVPRMREQAVEAVESLIYGGAVAIGADAE